MAIGKLFIYNLVTNLISADFLFVYYRKLIKDCRTYLSLLLKHDRKGNIIKTPKQRPYIINYWVRLRLIKNYLITNKINLKSLFVNLRILHFTFKGCWLRKKNYHLQFCY